MHLICAAGRNSTLAASGASLLAEVASANLAEVARAYEKATLRPENERVKTHNLGVSSLFHARNRPTEREQACLSGSSSHPQPSLPSSTTSRRQPARPYENLRRRCDSRSRTQPMPKSSVSSSIFTSPIGDSPTPTQTRRWRSDRSRAGTVAAQTERSNAGSRAASAGDPGTPHATVAINARGQIIGLTGELCYRPCGASASDWGTAGPANTSPSQLARDLRSLTSL